MLRFHGSTGYFVCLIFTHIESVCSLPGTGVTLPSYVVHIIYVLVSIGKVIVHFHFIGVAPTQGTLSFLFLPWQGCITWYLSPISSCVLFPLMIICSDFLVPTLVDHSCAVWASSVVGPLSCCPLVGLLLVLGVCSRYINCGWGKVCLGLFLLCEVCCMCD